MMAKLVLIGFGLVALFMASVFGWIGLTSRRQAQESVALRPLDAAAVARAELGAAGYVEGRISARNPERFRDFVLYYKSVLTGFTTDDGGERRPSWRSVDSVLPPLWLDVAGGEVYVFGAGGSGGYSVTFQGRDPTWVTPGELEPGETERYEGLPRGHPVTAIGHVADSAPEHRDVAVAEAEAEAVRGLRVHTLQSGTFADYQSGERGSALFGLIAAAVLGLVGVILIAVGASIS